MIFSSFLLLFLLKLLPSYSYLLECTESPPSDALSELRREYCDKFSAGIALGRCLPGRRSSSISRRSLKYGCFSICEADGLSSGLYVIIHRISSWHSLDTCDISVDIPVYFLGGKSNSMCVACFWNRCSSDDSGVPRMLWILWILMEMEN